MKNKKIVLGWGIPIAGHSKIGLAANLLLSLWLCVGKVGLTMCLEKYTFF
jgi:hypothetical protein